MAKLIALQPIDHDGKHHAPGSTLTVSDKAQIAQLIQVGAAALDGDKSRLAPPPVSSDPSAQEPGDGAATDASAQS